MIYGFRAGNERKSPAPGTVVRFLRIEHVPTGSKASGRLFDDAEIEKIVDVSGQGFMCEDGIIAGETRRFVEDMRYLYGCAEF